MSGGWDDERYGRARRPGQQQRRDYPVGGKLPMRAEPRRSRPEAPQSRRRGPQRESRSRVLAVVALVVAVIIVVLAGVAVGKGGESTGSDQSIPFSLLPFPQNAVTSTTQ